MIYKIKNDVLTVEINDDGAELYSIRKDNVEYLYNGNEKYWSGRSPIMFPVCGRLNGGGYNYRGKWYNMPIHGIVKTRQFKVYAQTQSSIMFVLKYDELTMPYYPFEFELYVNYTLYHNSLMVTFNVKNMDYEKLIYSVGGHPGFAVPLIRGENFEDYYLEFSSKTDAKKVGFSSDCLITGKDEPFDPNGLKRIDLKHELFDDDAIFLYDTAKTVSLKNTKNNHSVTIDFDDFKYLGIWHTPKTDAPFVCIEPWTSLPSDFDKKDDLMTKKEMATLKAYDDESYSFSITIE